VLDYRDWGACPELDSGSVSRGFGTVKRVNSEEWSVKNEKKEMGSNKSEE